VRILYVANHGAGGNDEEGAIAHALRSLGHDVTALPERKGRRVARLRADLLLFHHWQDYSALSSAHAPKAFWTFDLIEWPGDPELEKRNQRRREWVERITELADIGFMTDGDWVTKDRTGKLCWLPQAADSRIAGRGVDRIHPRAPMVLFTGSSTGCGKGRASWAAEMRRRWGELFVECQGVYGRDLADLIAAAAVVVAPDVPTTARYWSNRVYLTAGFGGFLLHPYCERLTAGYEGGKEIVYYRSRRELHALLDYWIVRDKERTEVAAAALTRTLRDHTYERRCERLVAVAKERLNLA
jgi:hypothetical protein